MVSSTEKIEQLVEQYEKEVKRIKGDSLKMCWYMRGGLSYGQAMNLGIQERELINEIIKENLDTTKKTNLPFF